MFERPGGGERAVLVFLHTAARDRQEDLQEFRALVASAGAEVAAELTGNLGTPNPATFIGRGKLEELRELVAGVQAELVLLSHALSPAQERNLERELRCRVVDRTGLILDIFAQRARTHEGKLQVELAQLAHLSTRLVRGWTHLERQKGGIGLRGPGETQLESDRRLLRARMDSIQRRLQKVRQQRSESRRGRQRSGIPTVSLVGYTNAGKSTLFNALTDAAVLAEDRLFATLDPTMRRLDIGAGQAIVLVDTVGFIRHLPHTLVEAFRATLEEACHADLLLHVVDAADPHRTGNIEQVELVLKEIGADSVPRLLVYNKSDLLPQLSERQHLGADGMPQAVWLSARRAQGLDLLREAVLARLGGGRRTYRFLLRAGDGELRARLYTIGEVLEERSDPDGGVRLRVRLSERNRASLARAWPAAAAAEAE